MSDLELFRFDGQQMRVVMVDGEPWFVAVDACALLGLKNVTMAVRGLDDDEKGVSTVETLGGAQELVIISEPGLYRLITRSRRPEAKAIMRWVTHDVLPSIRKTGAYGSAAPALPRTYSEALRELAAAVEERDQATHLVGELQPKAAIADTMLNAAGDYSYREAAGILTRRLSADIGQNRLAKLCEKLGWVDSRGIVVQRYREQGLIGTKAQVYTHPHTSEPTHARPQVRITPKGLGKLHRFLTDQQQFDL